MISHSGKRLFWVRKIRVWYYGTTV